MRELCAKGLYVFPLDKKSISAEVLSQSIWSLLIPLEEIELDIAIEYKRCYDMRV